MNIARLIPRFLRRSHRREEGQAAFEFLLVLPFFILFLLMAIDFGVLMYKYVSVSNAVREGARYASVNCGGSGCTADMVRNRVVERSGGILSDTADVSVDWPEGADRGDPVAVRVSHDHELLFFPAFTFDVRSCADMRLEQRDGGSPTGDGTGSCSS